MEVFTWFISTVALVGIILNIRKIGFCFVLWAFSNAAWAVIDFEKGIVAQGVLQLVYLTLSFYGIYKWSVLPKYSIETKEVTRDAKDPA